MFAYILIIVITILCAISYYIIFKRNINYWKDRGVVQEKASTSLGILLNFLLGNRSLAEICRDIYVKYSEEPCVGVLWGMKPALVLRDPDLIQNVLHGDFENFFARGFVTNPNDKLTDNIFFIDDLSRWKLIRQNISPIFTSAKLKKMFYILEHCSRDFTEYVASNIKEHPFNLLYTYTTASIGSAVFGIDRRAHNTMDSPFLEMSRKSVNPSVINNLRFFIGSVWERLFRLLQMKLLGDHEEFFIGVVKKVLQERRLEKLKRHDFIDICIELQKNGRMKDINMKGYEIDPTDELLAAQAFFFFLAGTETSASSMNFSLLELSRNPKILTKLQKEIDELFEQCKERPSYEDIDKMKYLEMVINEAIRKNPPVGLLQRRCTADTTLPNVNIEVAKDTMVIIPVYAIHMDEKLYPRPEVYDPERFRSSSNPSNINYTYMPFGEGKRLCLGNRFARLQVKIGLASLLRRFTVRPEASTPVTYERSFFALRATDKLYYTLQPRILNVSRVENSGRVVFRA